MFNLLFYILLQIVSCNHSLNPQNKEIEHKKVDPKIEVGADKYEEYLPLLKDKNVAIVCNHTARVGSEHLVDFLLKNDIQIKKVFAPEHGFRGTEKAGANINNEIDPITKLPIISLYGKNKKPLKEDLEQIDIIVFDIQDVGARFYTFLSTLHYVMESCAENNKELLILDRPNPNGHYVAGPILEESQKSFVGIAKIPVVHGLTLGEYAQMAKGEQWINPANSLKLKIISCSNYNHKSAYQVPIPPSPNLGNQQAIYLYPSLCLFEGTPISVGRGSIAPFNYIGCPQFKDMYPFSYVQKNKNEKEALGIINYGLDLSKNKFRRDENDFTLKYLIEFYKAYPEKDNFFLKNLFFDKLIGNSWVRQMILEGKSEKEIKSKWVNQLNDYKIMRKKYLLYPDFE
ncbi:MAG: DUF1343 domain-containing protein [Saprospiraceae bacterium]|nr:DUF1343 domain-containing protein [Saprospiraceae bacterium]